MKNGCPAVVHCVSHLPGSPDKCNMTFAPLTHTPARCLFENRISYLIFTYPPCDIPSGCCFFMGPWKVTRSSLRVLRQVAAFCRPVFLLVSFSRWRSPVVGTLGVVLEAPSELTIFYIERQLEKRPKRGGHFARRWNEPAVPGRYLVVCWRERQAIKAW